MSIQRLSSKKQNLPIEQKIIHTFDNGFQMHSHFLLLFQLEGSMNVDIYEEKSTLKQYDIFFLKPYEIYSISQLTSAISSIVFLIDYEFIIKYWPDMHSIYFEEHVISYDETNYLYNNLCTQLATMILNSLKNESSATLKIISATTNLLSIIIDSYGERQINSNDNANYIKERISLVLKYLNENYGEKISLSSAADYLGIHPKYLSTFFKKQIHMTFIDYLTRLRVNKALKLLINTDASITDIAISCGFNNHKTFSTAFKKDFHVTPTEYRKNFGLDHTNNYNFAPYNRPLEYFSFFQKYWNKNYHANLPLRTVQNHMSLSVSLLHPINSLEKYNQHHYFSVGHASLLLRSDVQMQLRAAKKELKFDGVRIRDIFSDELFVYLEDENKTPIIGWQYIDLILDFLYTNSMKPYIELGFMPNQLSSKKQFAGWSFQPNVSFPKSLKKWSILVTSFIEHLIERYSLEEVRTWYFDFWSSANLSESLSVKNSYWNESREDFFLLYRVTYNSIKNVDEEIQIGSPTFTLPNGKTWYDSFFKYCKENDIIPSFIRLSLFGTTDEYDYGSNNFIITDETSDTHYDKNTLLKVLNTLKDTIKKNNLEHLDIIASDWCTSVFPRDLIRDTCFMVPYILYNSLHMIGDVKSLSYHSLSDINETFFPNGKVFYGGAGILDFNGIKKASFYAFQLLNQLGSNIVEIGDAYIITRSKQGYQMLMYNLVYYDSLYSRNDSSALTYEERYNIYENSEDLVIHTILEVPEGAYTILKTELNRSSGSAYDVWMRMGSPQNLTPYLIDYINKQSIPHISYQRIEANPTLIMDTVIPAHGAVLLEITKCN